MYLLSFKIWGVSPNHCYSFWHTSWQLLSVVTCQEQWRPRLPLKLYYRIVVLLSKNQWTNHPEHSPGFCAIDLPWACCSSLFLYCHDDSGWRLFNADYPGEAQEPLFPLYYLKSELWREKSALNTIYYAIVKWLWLVEKWTLNKKDKWCQ